MEGPARLMWVARNKQTHELVTAQDHDPYEKRYDRDGKVLLEVPLAEQINPVTEEILWVDAPAAEIHAANSRAGEKTSFKIPNSGVPQVTPHTGPSPTPMPEALEQVAQEQAWSATRVMTVADFRRVMARFQGKG